jgi:hypothetical protein
MTTRLTRAIVSLAATMAVTLALGACVRGPSRPASDGPAPMDGHPLTIRFDNYGREHVHVYLVGTQRQWLLGRVEPGARATLRIPEAALAGSQGFVQLAVLTGERLTLQAARDPRATFTVAQPASAILSQQWMFAQGQLTSLPLRGARMGVGRR